jgi:hypothetical protein
MNYSTGDQPYCISTDDMNNDGYIDIIIANFGSNNIYIFYNDGNGTFSNQQRV